MIRPTRLDAYKLLHNGTLAFARAEQAGMRVDVDYCIRKSDHITRKIDFLINDFKRSSLYQDWERIMGHKTDINLDSQLGIILYKVRKIEPIKMTPSGAGGSTDEEALTQLNIPELDLWIEIRKLKKLKSTYLDALIREQVDGYVHPFFNLHIPKTYRSSSDHPNYQNIPSRDEESMNIIRGAIFPRPKHQIGCGDYKGIEVGVGACYHKDPNMIRYVTDRTTDMHRDMAQQIFKINRIDHKAHVSHYLLRQAGKNGFVFPEFYGDYYKACTQNMACQWGKLPKGEWRPGQGIPLIDGHLSEHLISVGIRSYDQFEEHVRKVEEDFWGNRFRVYQQWKDRWWSQYQVNGYFDMYTGFRCSGLMRKNDTSNYPIQGSAFHCLLWAFIEIDRIAQEEKWDTKLIGQIHDQIVMDINPSELEHVMKTVHYVSCIAIRKVWDWIIVPLEVDFEICDVDEPWSKKKPYKIAA